MSLFKQFAKPVKGFICSRVGANHALCGIIIMCEGIIRFGVGLLMIFFFECGGDISRHAV